MTVESLVVVLCRGGGVGCVSDRECVCVWICVRTGVSLRSGVNVRACEGVNLRVSGCLCLCRSHCV